MRINRYLAEAGVASRRACDKLIEEGKVTVNGKRAQVGMEVDFSDHVAVEGRAVRPVEKNVYYLMNKPKGYVTTVKDDKGRKTVMDLLPKKAERVYPVGRLDYDTEGLLIITNDGDLANRLTHPTNEIPKTYIAKIEGHVKEDDLAKLRSGVIIDGVKTKRCSVRIVEEDKESTKISVTITEGRNRQVRKMFEAVGHNVVFLKRTKIGDLSISGLNRGEVRTLSQKEVFYLKNL
ncbi:MAG: rRNA pseudouridine synthase [Clostridia bacterium]|nr:rRNA pseudouridine synthase [Clostridia bacterium]